jgi:hypothetical protein
MFPPLFEFLTGTVAQAPLKTHLGLDPGGAGAPGAPGRAHWSAADGLGIAPDLDSMGDSGSGDPLGPGHRR